MSKQASKGSRRRQSEIRAGRRLLLQWLKDFGRQKVHDQIERVVTIIKLCDDKDDFRKKFARVFKKSALAGQMSFNWDQP